MSAPLSIAHFRVVAKRKCWPPSTIQIAEAMEYAHAHWLAGGMVLFSFIVLLGLALLRRRGGGAMPR